MPDTTSLLLASGLVGALFGVVLHRGRFCTMGAVADIVSMGDWTRMRVWCLAIAVAMTGLHAGALVYDWRIENTFYAQPRVFWLSHLLGGLLFGRGMVLASGCGSQTLMRMGAGNLKSMVVAIVMAVTALSALKGILALLRVDVFNAVFFELDRPSNLSASLGHHAALSVALLLAVLALSNKGMWQVRHWATGLSLGLLATAAWYLTLQAGYLPENPDTLQPMWLATYTGRPEALTFTAPMAHWLEWFSYASDTSRRMSMGMTAALGVVLGAFVSARSRGKLHIEGFRQVDDFKRHLVGGVLMGFGGVLAMGCSIGQGLTGISTLSLGSVIALAGIVAGAMWQLRRDLNTLA